MEATFFSSLPLFVFSICRVSSSMLGTGSNVSVLFDAQVSSTPPREGSLGKLNNFEDFPGTWFYLFAFES